MTEELKYEDLKCKKLEKKDVETEEEDKVTYKATFRKENKDVGTFVQITITSDQPIPAKQGEKLSFKAYTNQTTLPPKI